MTDETTLAERLDFMKLVKPRILGSSLGMAPISRTAQPWETCVREGRIVALLPLSMNLPASRREPETRSPRPRQRLFSA